MARQNDIGRIDYNGSNLAIGFNILRQIGQLVGILSIAIQKAILTMWDQQIDFLFNINLVEAVRSFV